MAAAGPVPTPQSLQSAVKGDALLTQHRQGEGGHGPLGRKQGQPWLAASNPRLHTNSSHEGRGLVRAQLALRVHGTFSFSRRRPENTRRIRWWFGTCLQGSPKRSCARIRSRMFTFIRGLRGWVVMGAEVLHSGRMRGGRGSGAWPPVVPRL